MRGIEGERFGRFVRDSSRHGERGRSWERSRGRERVGRPPSHHVERDRSRAKQVGDYHHIVRDNVGHRHGGLVRGLNYPNKVSGDDYHQGYPRDHHKNFLTHGNNRRGILGPKPSLYDSSFQLPPPFKKSFSSLFSPPAPNHRSADPQSQILEDEKGWTKVVHRRRSSKANRQAKPLPPPSIKRCFFCGDRSHLANSCKMGSFVCFKCNRTGHKARDCPSSLKPIPTVELPASIKDHIEALSSSAIFYVSHGDPSLSELKEMMDFKFNVRKWPHKIARAAGKNFLVQFPDDEMIDLAEDMKMVDMGTFKGRFLRWREDLGLKIIPEPVLTWVKIDHLPLHLWDWEFLQTLFKDVGECITCSDDVAFRHHFANCKVLLKVRDLSIIPSEIRFRCFSPVGKSLFEGFASLKVIGKIIKEKDWVNKFEVREHALKWEGEVSSSSGWADRGGSDEEVSRPPPAIDRAFRSEADEGRKKGKMVISSFSNSKDAGIKEKIKESSDLLIQDRTFFNYPPTARPQSAAVIDNPDLIQVYWNGNDITVERGQWEDFLRIQGAGGSFVPGHQSAKPSSDSSSASPSESAKEGSNSLSIPPGFGPLAKAIKKKNIGGSRLSKKTGSAKKFRKFLAASRSRTKTLSSKGGKNSSSSASIALPINAKSDADIINLAVNCGLQEPKGLEGITSLKTLEVERMQESK